ncbi:UDP-glycosyltransferase 91A1 [Forsythia ovata]|uniref:Glycosyltransferase n=1 Tax=Forsythia ovata TaxID=205694 RepID=A0ABD1UTW1_9LAMI
MDSRSKLHVVMFPWLVFGHIIPYFELSKFIAEKGHKISFVSTPRNIDRLPKIPPHLVSSITLVMLPFPKIEQLPESAEATMDIKNEDMPYLKKAFDGLENELTRFLEDSAPDWILYDFAAHWLPPVAARLEFLTLINGSDERNKAEDFLIPPKWVRFETNVAYRRYEANWIVAATQKNDSGASDVYRCGKVIDGCEVIFIRHCYEFESDWLKVLEELRLVYVALGSEVTSSQDQLNELALGLELSGVPFFWALRKPSGTVESYSVDLPDGFEERVKGRGMVWKSWAPQLKILSHDSVGGFLTHCGWSSFVEGLTFGHPLIALPFLVDQGLNDRIIADKQIGIEIPKNDEDGSYTKNSVSETVKLVMVENEGKKFRDKAKEMSAIFGDRHSSLNFFIAFISSTFQYLIHLVSDKWRFEPLTSPLRCSIGTSIPLKFLLRWMSRV